LVVDNSSEKFDLIAKAKKNQKIEVIHIEKWEQLKSLDYE